MGKIFTLEADVKSIITDAIDDLILELGKDCRIVYPPKMTLCANCVSDPIGHKPSNRWKNGGPMQFHMGSLCPMCDGEGRRAEEVSESVRFLCEWDPKKFFHPIKSVDVRVPLSFLQTKGYLTDMSKVLRCDHLIFQTAIEGHIRFKYKLVGEPGDYSNIIQERYFIAIWGAPSIMFTISLDLDSAQTTRAAVDSLVRRFTAIVNNMVGPVRTGVERAIDQLIRGSEEYVSLTDPRGQLRGHLGLAGELSGLSLAQGASIDPIEFIDRMIVAICNSIRVEVDPFVRSGDSFIGGIIVRVLRSDFQDLLTLSGAEYISRNRRGEAHPVPWLHWLLLGGAGDLVTTHFYLNVPQVNRFSRTSMGIMAKGGGGWGIPSEYAGNATNNWLTRALAPLVTGSSILFVIFEQELRRRL